MTADGLFLRHTFTEGDPGSPVLLLLHGTGGGPEDIAVLGKRIAPSAPLLAPAGSVSENGAARWFRRHAEGVFDEADVRERTEELAEFVRRAREHYGLTDRRIVAAGFSNGANIAAALTLLRPDVLSEAVLFAAMLPVGDPPWHELTGSRVWMSNGERDPMAPLPAVERLTETLHRRGAEVTAHRHRGGHEITGEALERAAAWLNT
ncbi:alpha/beta hydrolase [Actinopolyspora saharensis]|uniref:Phospholipase/carboxylesterase n=1 Tax=Actinopolyspora saharensis TaxID=995062 RepID=A0A1H0ZZD8_9ACTN|nr:alpha/beta hydrolase [Actinopolyspora saharensis]SDQ32834.1 phospholipase/carboxylesterase [Actinopolyspora saharensis]